VPRPRRASALFHQLLGEDHPHHYTTLCGEASVSSMALCRLLLYGYHVEPSKEGRRNPRMGANDFSMTAQDYTVTSGRRERSSPSPSALCGRPRHCNTTPGTVTTSPTLLKRTGDRTSPRPPLYLVQPPVDTTLEPARGRQPDSQPLHHYPRSRSCTGTGLATTPQQERDSPGQPSTPWHCTPYLYT
jgi:hypothetical protein